MMRRLLSSKAVFIGTSAGGVTALNKIFKGLPQNFHKPIFVVLHLGEKPFIPGAFYCPQGVKIVEAEEKEQIQHAHIYFAPADYHLLVESDMTLSLTTEDKVQFARPSLDVTMDSLANVYGQDLVGIVLTGANEDGADGLAKIKEFGGITIVQKPEDSEYDSMPLAAIKKTGPDFILTLDEIISLLKKIEGNI